MAEPQSKMADIFTKFKESEQNIRLFLNIYEIHVSFIFQDNPDDRSSLFLEDGQLKPNYVPRVLFEVFSQVLSYPKWFYNPEKTDRYNLLALPIGNYQDIDCVEIMQAFIDLSVMLGVDKKDVQEIIYRNRLSKKLKISHPGIDGPFMCFDKKADDWFESNGDVFCFHKHCVAKIYDTHYDLTFLCFYKDNLAPFDTSPKAELFHAAKSKDVKTFAEILKANPELDLNDSIACHGTLLQCSAPYEPFLPALKMHQEKRKLQEKTMQQEKGMPQQKMMQQQITMPQTSQLF